jgi:hypothetical protein
VTDAPPIQYATTSDGVSIAYWTYGQGPPLVVLPLLIGSHVQLEWEVPFRRLIRQLVVGKGFVFSDRGDHALKGFEDLVRLYEVAWRES